MRVLYSELLLDHYYFRPIIGNVLITRKQKKKRWYRQHS